MTSISKASLLLVIVLNCSCSSSNRVSFATNSEVVLEHGQRFMNKELASRSAELTKGLLPAGATGLYVNRALVDSAGNTCLLIAISQTMDRETLDSLFHADSRCRMGETSEFSSTTDIRYTTWSRGDSTVQTYSFYEPGSGVLVHMAALQGRFDQAWFKRCVALSAP